VKRILRSRLPERLADKVPRLVVEVAVAFAATTLMTLLRMALLPWAADSAPFAFVFIAAIGSTVLAGWRSGVLAVVIGQLLAWFLIIDPANFQIQKTQYVGGFIAATLAQLVAVVIIWLYQREVDRAWSRREAQVDLIRQALAEIDHRTANNYQTVLSLVGAQARRAKEAPVKEALQQVVDRIKAIALASRQLALSSESLEQVRVTHHIGELCAQIRRGLSRPGVKLEWQIDDVSIGAEQAIAMSILVNELVTNALKHAFPDDRQGEIRVSLGKAPNGVLLEVADDGIGMKGSSRTRGTGLGSRLVATFVKQLNARHEVESGDDGTRHRILFPVAA
jgi:two-component sensor histidine kinase